MVRFYDAMTIQQPKKFERAIQIAKVIIVNKILNGFSFTLSKNSSSPLIKFTEPNVIIIIMTIRYGIDKYALIF